MKSAVLVIDVQQGLCEGEGAAFDCEGTISRINDVTRKARQAGVPVIFIQHESQMATWNIELPHGKISSFGPRVQAVPSGSIKFV